VKEKLFVYGTLCPDRPNEHILKHIGGSFEEASVRGILHNEGWGATMGYPALVVDPDGEEVKGFLFISKNLPKHWSELDDFEGEAYERTLTTVELKDGARTEAYVYVLKRQ
jgi:gamma-glutamylcyclotransferase (GGCT)/AIG2-like uncharacterized protein YtfP